ncbi:hypothetical protein V2G26_009372 [Clonostachys chloroleuca]
MIVSLRPRGIKISRPAPLFVADRAVARHMQSHSHQPQIPNTDRLPYKQTTYPTTVLIEDGLLSIVVNQDFTLYKFRENFV